MESAIMELELDELKAGSGGDDADLTREEALDLVRRLARTGIRRKSAFEDALRVAVIVCGRLLPLADIEACVRSVYGL